MEKGIFTISLDFELFWGVRDHRTTKNYGEQILNVAEVVPRLLNMFEKYGVHCTWATVGFLFFTNKKELVNNLPLRKPEYLKKEYDPYSYLLENELLPEFHFAPQLIEMIKKVPGQEIATHTFSHFYTLEKNTTPEQFRDDLIAAIAVAKQHGIELSSIVFPRNQYSEAHILVCKQLGIKVYRGNESSKAYQPISRENENYLRRAIRFADSYINITGHHTHSLPESNTIINVPASRFLRPFNPDLKWLENLRFRRIQSGMKYAAQKGLIYQLWWHPHNFGKYMDENFNFLEKVLKLYQQLNLEGEMISQNLIEIYSNSVDHEKN